MTNENKLNLSENAQNIFKTLYSFTDETIPETFIRVAKEFATDDASFKFAYDLMQNNIWRPNTPVFFNAGTNEKLFSACWVVGLNDSMDSIYDIANVARKIFQYGAGIGIPIGNLRENDANIYGKVKDENRVPIGKSSGAISFMKLYDVIGETTKSGGRTRRAAILCAMPVDHPDILDFISCKEIDGRLSNMNISVSIDDKFMQALKDKVSYKLISPTGEEKGSIDALHVWDKLCEMSHKTADPGILFIDTINESNLLKSKIKIECTNPCITGDTLVTMEDDLCIPVKDIQVGDKIKSYNIETNEYEIDIVEWVGITRKNAKVIELEVEEDGKIYKLRCTHDHPIYTRNRGYVEAKNLTINDDILINSN